VVAAAVAVVAAGTALMIPVPAPACIPAAEGAHPVKASAVADPNNSEQNSGSPSGAARFFNTTVELKY